MLSENADATRYVRIDTTTTHRPEEMTERELGFCWAHEDPPLSGTLFASWPTDCGGEDPVKINGCFGLNPPENSVTRPSSYHPGGVVASFLDGHQQFINDMIGFDVWRHIATPDGGRVGLPGVLDEASLKTN